MNAVERVLEYTHLGNNNRVDRVLYRLFLQSSELGLPTPPLQPQASVSPPFWFQGGHTRLRERGWGSQFGRGDRRGVITQEKTSYLFFFRIKEKYLEIELSTVIKS
jgi:hypothetical protein